MRTPLLSSVLVLASCASAGGDDPGVPADVPVLGDAGSHDVTGDVPWADVSAGDTALTDVTPGDTATADALSLDAGPSDVAPVDATTSDASRMDVSPVDAVTPDAASADTVTADAGPTDVPGRDVITHGPYGMWTPAGPAVDNSYLDTYAMWTGHEVLLWGTLAAGRYDPSTDTLRPLTFTNGPALPRFPGNQYTVAWDPAGQRLYEVGGLTTEPPRSFDPATDTWTALPLTAAPTPSAYAAMTVTSDRVFVWGGQTGSSGTFLATGAEYLLHGGYWMTLPTAGAPTARSGASAVWTGTEVIVFGGCASSTRWHDACQSGGARYNPVTRTWAAMSGTGMPAPRGGASIVWTGREMLVWGGGYNTTGINPYADGARYNPTTDTWTRMATAPIAAREDASAVWTGTELVIWGGWGSSSFLGDGARYNPTTDSWTLVSLDGAPAVRTGPGAAWIGDGMVVLAGRLEGPGTPSAVRGGIWRP